MYTKRTCNNCGIRKPQPQMYQREVTVKTGKSRQGLSKRTLMGALLGDNKSNNSLHSWVFNTNQRTYSRNKKVWLCDHCVPKKKYTFLDTLGYWIWKAICYFFYAILIAFFLIVILAQ